MVQCEGRRRNGVEDKNPIGTVPKTVPKPKSRKLHSTRIPCKSLRPETQLKRGEPLCLPTE